MRIVDLISEWSGRAVSWLFLLTVFSVFYEVVGRYFFNSPTSWGFETSLYGSAAAIITSGGYCMRHRTHIAITAVSDLLPPKLRRYLDIFNLIFAAIICLIMAYATAEWGWDALISWQRTGSAWNPPAPALVKPLIPLSFGLIGLQAIVNAWRTYQGSDDAEPEHNETDTRVI